MALNVTGSKSPEQVTLERLIGELVGGDNVQLRISDILTNLSTVDTVVDGLQSDLDNATDGLGALKAAIVGAQSSLDNGTYGLSALNVDLDSLLASVGTMTNLGSGATISGNLVAIDTVVDTISANVSHATFGLAALDTDLANIEADTQDLQSKIGTPAGASLSADVAAIYSRVGAPVGSNISADIAALKSVADNINNSTRVNASVATLLEVPETGTAYYHVSHNIFDSAGLPTDSNGDAVYFRVINPAGATKTGVYFSDAAGTAITAASGLTGTAAAFNGWYAMDTTPVGRAAAWIGLASTATQEGLTVEFGHVDAVATNKAIVVSRSTQAVNYLQAQGQAGVTADATWDETLADHLSVGSTGAALTDVLADTNELQAEFVDGGRLDVIFDAILADTAELQADLTNGGRLDLILDAILADSNELQLDWANGGRLDLIVDAILADTAELQSDWVNGGRLDLILDELTVQGDTLETKVDALSTKIGTPVGADVSADIAAVKAQTAAIEIDTADIQAKIGTPASSLAADIAVIDGLLDVASADAATNLTIRDVIGSKVDTVAGTSVVALVKKVQQTLDLDESAGTLFKAAKTTDALAQGANSLLTMGVAEGFDCFNAQISRLKVTPTGAVSNYTVQIYEKSDASVGNLLWEATEDAGAKIDLMFDNMHFINNDSTVAKNIYVKVTNNTDVSTSLFAVEVRGEKKSDALA